MSRTSLGHRAPLCWLLFPFMSGLILAKLSPITLPYLPLMMFAFAAVLAALVFAPARPTLWAISLTTSLVAIGASYYELRRSRLPDWELLPDREAVLTVEIGRVFAQPDRPESFAALGRITLADGHLLDLIGQPVSLNLRLSDHDTRPIRGDTVRVSGVLESLPRRSDEGGFHAYLVDAGLNFRLQRGRLLQLVEPAGGYAQWRERMRQHASAQLGHGLEKHAALAAALRGMLLGERNGLTDEQQNLYLRSGAMHFFAISGLHIGVIAGGLIAGLRLMRLPRIATLIVAAVVLAFYVDLTGALPSAVRAWLMATCLYGAIVFRVPGNSVAALAASALLVLLLDPMQLFGVGFQMSYAIMVALLLYGLPLSAHWTHSTALWRYLPPVSRAWYHDLSAAAWHWFVGASAVTLAAALVGTLSGVAFFGFFTPIAVVANLLLMPLATGAILAGFLSLLSGLVGFSALGLIFNHAAALLLLGMQAVLETLTGLPGGTSPAHLRAEWIGHAGLLLLVSVMVWGYSTRWRQPLTGYWSPVLYVAAILIVGMQLGE